jgi:hypothetical protein
VAKRRKEWPDWWEWELELRSYTYKRLKERDCTEIELRRMMEHARTFKPAKLEGRWVIETRFQGALWKIVVEPAPEKRRLVVVTAYEVEKLK